MCADGRVKSVEPVFKQISVYRLTRLLFSLIMRAGERRSAVIHANVQPQKLFQSVYGKSNTKEVLTDSRSSYSEFQKAGYASK